MFLLQYYVRMNIQEPRRPYLTMNRQTEKTGSHVKTFQWVRGEMFWDLGKG